MKTRLLLALLLFCSLYYGCEDSKITSALTQYRNDYASSYETFENIKQTGFNIAEEDIYNNWDKEANHKKEEEIVYNILVYEKESAHNIAQLKELIYSDIEQTVSIVKDPKYSAYLKELLSLVMVSDKRYIPNEDAIDFPLSAKCRKFLISSLKKDMRQNVTDILKQKYQGEHNIVLRFTLNELLTRRGDIDALGRLIDNLWFAKYFSKDAGSTNNWGSDIKKIPVPPFVWFSNYEEALEYLTKYTENKFGSIPQWQNWYNKNKDNIVWDAEKRKYIVK